MDSSQNTNDTSTKTTQGNLHKRLQTKELSMEIEQTKEEAVVVENLSDRLVKDFGEFDPTLELSNYKFPTIELLKDYTAGQGITINQEELEENKNRIVETLNNYKIGIASIKATVGPTVTYMKLFQMLEYAYQKLKTLRMTLHFLFLHLGYES